MAGFAVGERSEAPVQYNHEGLIPRHGYTLTRAAAAFCHCLQMNWEAIAPLMEIEDVIV